ncbi:MAG TPA: ThuA domain-containing protein [Gemmatales bacterium]|nr:ThuA domain-containing protein [Gemmatales bacterium]
MNRRDFLMSASASVAVSSFPLGWTAAGSGRRPRLMFFTRRPGFQHDVVNRALGGKDGRLGTPGELSHAEAVVQKLGADHGFDVDCTKDGRVFIPEEIAKYDAFFFYTTLDLTAEKATDGSPPMPKEGKKLLLDAIAGGKGFIGAHCASDTFHSPRYMNFVDNPPGERDPYINMLGGEFVTHGAQQKAKMVVTSEAFYQPRLADFELNEEWYSLKNFADDLHVILAQDSTGMKGPMYQRPLFPATWARRHGSGRVFYTSMGHREDVWTNALFQRILLGGLAWSFGQTQWDVSPNIDVITPHARQLPKQ